MWTYRSINSGFQITNGMLILLRSNVLSLKTDIIHGDRHNFTLYYCHNIAMIACEKKNKEIATFYHLKTEICNLMYIQSTAEITEHSGFITVVAELKCP